MLTSSSHGYWTTAAVLLERWLEGRERVDHLLDEAGWRDGGPFETARARCQHLLYGAVRHLGRLNAAIDTLVAKPPRPRLRAVLLVAGFELLEAAGPAAGQAARIVHHAVEQAKVLLSPAEAGMVNAVLRRLPAAIGAETAAPQAGAAPGELARFFSHPEWLVRRWLAQFGAPATLSLLNWNQTPPPVYARWRMPGAPPAWLQAAAWPGYHVVPAGRWPEVERLLADGALYLQDPATQLAVELLDPRPGETALDLCAAPGGKSLLMADRLAAGLQPESSPGVVILEGSPPRGPGTAQGPSLQENPRMTPHWSLPAAGERGEPPSGAPPGGEKKGGVVAVDLPDDVRIGRLKENLARARGVNVALVQADVLKLSPGLFKEHGLPADYAAVLLDVPCSNTGVMRHRVDVKWRLRESDIERHGAQQLALLSAAARRVAAGGRLVYSTCSLEPEENEGVVGAFLGVAGRGRFTLETARCSRPWETGCDGAAAFLLRRVS